MSEFQPLIDQLYFEEVLRTRAMSPEDRMNLALDLSEANIAWSEGAGDPELSRRMRLLRESDDRRYYGPPVPRL
jgi:hypothetical protein